MLKFFSHVIVQVLLLILSPLKFLLPGSQVFAEPLWQLVCSEYAGRKMHCNFLEFAFPDASPIRTLDHEFIN
jgi:hypothetical protein